MKIYRMKVTEVTPTRDTFAPRPGTADTDYTHQMGLRVTLLYETNSSSSKLYLTITDQQEVERLLEEWIAWCRDEGVQPFYALSQVEQVGK